MEQYKGKENERGKEANSPETKHLPEIHVHVGNFLPWSAVVKNSTLIKWTEKTGADKLEWMAVGPVSEKVPVGPTHEVLAKPVSALQEIFGKTLGHGHVIFNPYASLWGILGRKPDPLRPGESLALYNLILSNEAVSRNALQKLEMVKENKFPVVVYPPFRGTEIQSKYKESYLQTHPAFYDDARNTENLIKAVRSGEYSKICVDTYHFREATQVGERPFGKTEKELFQTLEKLHRAGVLGEVHVQPGRMLHLDTTIETQEELKTIFGENPSYDTQLGRTLQFLIHDLEFMGPYTFEVDPRALVKIYGKKILLPPNCGKILEAQSAAIDYMRRA
ncbi:hypothetical protein A3J56_01060 [Candidatus Giovannonibacteria bacterium RIFCSPHIGHO2_02_FULL_46_20]|uniref:Uncharacterized protein n=1 Tax=Candidatus Giovannonibacteria bacterium RIFCSPHIGHO2_02_FULL_46_20 TaxID=1798338 RepID=A0A1F5WGX0_9BACT|nr:MAG: hypothetical protein A3J56_01060 [Candidatus Giovannonibacteria bacterium RIFCSPHIGHO2_02_FULL_46_20]